MRHNNRQGFTLKLHTITLVSIVLMIFVTNLLSACNNSAPKIVSDDASRFLADTWPRSNSSLTESEFGSPDYRSEKWSQIDAQSWPVPLKPSLCAWIDLQQVLEEGGDYRGGVKEQVSLVIDGNEVGTSAMEFTPDLYVEIRKEGWRSSAIYSGSPYQMCWPITLKSGTHHVTVSYQKLSGEMVSNSWEFEIVDTSP
jgi:hypothetical protein